LAVRINLDEDSEDGAVNVDRISSLPTELLVTIVDHLPASFFQEDVSRLTISKRWYGLAWPLFLPRLETTPRVMGRMANIGTEELNESLVPLLQANSCDAPVSSSRMLAEDGLAVAAAESCTTGS
jgi:hypothetical protein